MDNQTTQEIAIGDQVFLTERTFSSDTRQVTARIVDIRWILGKQSFVIETEAGKRKVVGPDQVSPATEK